MGDRRTERCGDDGAVSRQTGPQSPQWHPKEQVPFLGVTTPPLGALSILTLDFLS